MRLNVRYSDRRPPLIPYYPTLYTHHHFHLTLVNSIGYSYLRCKFNRVAKRKIKPVPKYLQDNKKALKAISWAFRSDLRAYPIPSGSEYHIEIDNGLKRIKSPHTYKKQELTEKLWDIYLHYYDKHLEKVGYES